MEELFKSVKAHLYDRSSSPLFGAFMLSWSVWNYRVLTILFSDENIEDKFSAIDKQFESFDFLTLQINGAHIDGFLIPALFALFYIYIYPVISEPVYKFSLEKRRKLREIKQASDDLRLLSVEDSRAIYKELALAKARHGEEVEKYNKQNSENQKSINELQTELDKIKDEQNKNSQGASESKPFDANEFSENVGFENALLESVNKISLIRYSKLKYPGRGISKGWQERFLKDVDKTNYKIIGDIDAAVNKAILAVETYRRDNPNTFNYGTDYISKSMGFVDPDFRAQHSWSSETQEAFKNYEHLVDRG